MPCKFQVHGSKNSCWLRICIISLGEKHKIIFEPGGGGGGVEYVGMYNMLYNFQCLYIKRVNEHVTLNHWYQKF